MSRISLLRGDCDARIRRWGPSVVNLLSLDSRRFPWVCGSVEDIFKGAGVRVVLLGRMVVKDGGEGKSANVP